MAFDTVIDQIKAVRGETEVVIVKLGDVTGLSNGRAQVRIYGDSDASNKLYNYISGYIPEVGDKVALLPQGKTYIILGKVTDQKPEEIYARKEWVEENYLPDDYKNVLEQGDGETLTFTNNELVPKTTNKHSLGSSNYNFKNLYLKKLILDGAEYTDIDRIIVKNSGTTYSLTAAYSSNKVTLEPSVDDMWKLGTSAKQLAEAWIKLFRGTWKSGQSTERAISWNSSNALVPDANNSVDFGSSSNQFNAIYTKKLYLDGSEIETNIAALKVKYENTTYSLTLSILNPGEGNQYEQILPSINGKFVLGSSSRNFDSIYAQCWAYGSYYLYWDSSKNIIPSGSNSINLGTASKQFNKLYVKEIYLNGNLIDGINIDTLTATSGSYTRTLKLSASSTGATIIPSVNNAFELGSSSFKFKSVYADVFYGFLDGALKDGGQEIKFDSNHNLNPSTTNYISLGTSNKQYKNVYGQNLYVNGSAVSSDRNLKEEIESLEEKHVKFFKNLKPVSYKFKGGTSGRRHTGFIAQEVEEAIKEAGMTDKDMAAVVKNESQYYLRYEEIIAVQTKVIQDLMARVEKLEAKVNRLEAERSRT